MRLPESAMRLLEVFGSSRIGIRTKFALALVAEGMSYREAADVTGYGGDHSDLYWVAKRYGLTEIHRERCTYGRGTRNVAADSAPQDT